MRVLISTNFNKAGGADCTRRVVRKLAELGLTPMLDERDAERAGITEAKNSCTVGPLEDLLPLSDVILTIGGDGTILRALQWTLGGEKPLIGVNTGRIGFLTQIEADELDKLAALREGNFKVHRRMLLEVVLMQNGREESFLALNDAVLSRGQSERLVEIAVTCGENPVASHRSDGLIFSTPTGSTAYNLAAGGPVADPGLNLILMTAICPHSYCHHTMILSPEQVYTVKEVAGNNKSGLALSLDGRKVGVLYAKGEIQIRRAQAQASFIDLGLRDFYRRVDVKLRVGK